MLKGATMTRGTTPTYIINFEETVDFSTVASWLVTFSQMGHELLSLDNPIVDLTENTLTITLTQEQTLLFQKGVASIQVRGMFGDGVAFASNIGCVPINPVLDERVLS